MCQARTHREARVRQGRERRPLGRRTGHRHGTLLKRATGQLEQVLFTDHGWHGVHLHPRPFESRVSSGVKRAHEPRMRLAIVRVLWSVVERARGKAALRAAPFAEGFALLQRHRLEELFQLLLAEARHSGHTRRGGGGAISSSFRLRLGLLHLQARNL